MSGVAIRVRVGLLVGLVGLVAWSPQRARAQELEANRESTPAEANAEHGAPGAPEPDLSELEAPASHAPEALEPGAPEPASPEPEVLEPEVPEPPRTAGIEEITITSQGREQTSQEASIAVTAFNAEYLDALGARNIADLSQFTPNLEIRTVFSASNPTLFIRGVGLRDFNANSASSVAVYNDDVYMNSPAGQLGQLFDLEQVEVLRGPQGALYGRNASAGAIRVISRKPRGDEISGFASATYGRFDQLDVSGAIEAPLVPDMLSLRISGIMHTRDGYTTNRCADDDYWRSADFDKDSASLAWRVFAACFNNDTRRNPPVGQGWNAGAPYPTPVGLGAGAIKNATNAVVPSDIEKKVNDVDDWAGRGLLRLQPSGGSDWIFNVHGGRNRSQARQFQMIGAAPRLGGGGLDLGTGDFNSYIDPDNALVSAKQPEDGDPFEGDYNRTGPERLDLLGANASGYIPIGDGSVSLRSITAYEWNDRLVETNPDGNPYIGLEVDFGNTAWQASQELKASWDAGGAVTWQLGLNFLYEELEAENLFLLNRTSKTRQQYEQETYYGSAYGYFAWTPADELSLEGGLRWNVEHKNYAIRSNLDTLFLSAATETQRQDVTEQAPSGDFSIHYRPVEDVNFYAKYSRGWKGPHFNGSILNTQPGSALAADLIQPVKPESVNALEIGLKSMWLDSRLRLNAAAFYYDYKNIQIFQVRNAAAGIPVQELLNANDADVYGVEFEVESRPLDGWAPSYLEGLTVMGAFGWLESSYTDFVLRREEFGSGGTLRISTEDFSGNRLINSPRFSVIGYAQWDLPLGRYGALVPRLDWSYKDDVFFSPSNLEPVSQKALWLLNARLAYRTPGDAFEVAGWVRNLTDEVYRVDVIDLSRFRQSILYAMGTPRTYGVTLTVQF